MRWVDGAAERWTARARRLVDESGGLARLTAVPGFFDADVFSQADVASALAHIGRSRTYYRDLRVFRGSGEDPALAQSVTKRPPGNDEPLASWGKVLFGENARWAVIAYRLERHNARLAEHAARLAHSLGQIGAAGSVGAVGIELMAFIGNYGFSPVGAHKDRDQGCTVHLNLGPRSKKLTAWDDATFAERTGSTDSCFDPASILDAGRTIEFGPGDAAVLPAGGYHVGYAEDVSVDLAVSFVDLNSRRLARRLIDVVDERVFGEAPSDSLAPRGWMAGWESLTNVGGAALDRSLAESLREAFDEVVGSISSNGGFRYAPPEQDIVEPLPSVIAIVRPFTLILRRGSGRSALFARGRRLEFPDHTALPAFVERANSGDPLSRKQVHEMFSDGWSPRAVDELLRLLMRAGALARA